MSEIVAATAAELLEAVAATPAQGTSTYAEWAADQAFKRIVDQTTPGYEPPVYRWNYDPAADEAFSRIVDETSADGAWQAWKDAGGSVSKGGSAAPNPTVKVSPQTAIKKPAAAGASAGGLLSMSLPTWTAAVAPLLGVAVGAGLYELSPEFWEKVSRTLLPFCYEGTQCMPVVTDEDGNTYVDKDAVEALKQLFQEEGVGGDGSASATYEGGSIALTTNALEWEAANRIWRIVGGYFAKTGATNPSTGLATLTPVSFSPGAYVEVIQRNTGTVIGTNPINYPYTSGGTTLGYYGNAFSAPCDIADPVTPSGVSQFKIIFEGDIQTSGNYPEGTSKWEGDTVDVGNLPITKVYTDPTDETKTKDYIPVACPTQPGVSVDSTENPDPTTNTDPEEQISPYITPDIPADQYPEGSETEETEDLDKDAPIPTPSPAPQTEPDPDTDPSEPPDDPPQQLEDILPPIDTGDVPLPDMPEGGSDPQGADGGVGGLVSVYNPTYAELTAFSQWLWVTYADATIDKIWNNPFDGIISLHELYATPIKGGRKYIKSGFLVSPVDSITVPNRYSEINCGSAIVPEYYGNYLDYSPYSKAMCYLPFIGIVELNVDDIVGHAINIRYRVDSYSGACIALIDCAKENGSAVLYQFSGNCSVQMPIAGGTQANIKAAQISAGAYQNAYHVAGVAGLIGGIASGAAQVVGGLASMAASAAGTGGIGQIGSGVASVIQGAGQKMTQEAFGKAAAVSQTVAAKSSVQHSGQFGESFGAMGAKRPYLIIKRPVQVVVPNYQNEYGYPAHKYVTIGACTGYLRCRGVHVVSARATDAELQLIEQELMGGVFVT